MTEHAAAETEIRALLAEHATAHAARDAERVLGLYLPDAVAYTLAPPLQQGPHTPYGTVQGLQEWFATFDGPVDLSYRDVGVSVATPCGRTLLVLVPVDVRLPTGRGPVADRAPARVDTVPHGRIVPGGNRAAALSGPNRHHSPHRSTQWRRSGGGDRDRQDQGGERLLVEVPLGFVADNIVSRDGSWPVEPRQTRSSRNQSDVGFVERLPDECLKPSSLPGGPRASCS